MEDLWTTCQGQQYITSLQETAWRLIEAQHVFATRKLVDSAYEQEILEEIIETVKPTFFGREFAGLHPLLYTPFRYPPLKYGSRFGKYTERALWYGSLNLTTAMAEKAFYTFNFIRASKASFGIIELHLTAFSAIIKTEKGLLLTEKPFAEYTKRISSPSQYEESQTLGSSMRYAKVEAFSYHSARDPQNKINIAAFTPHVFLNKKPISHSFQTWNCIINHQTAEFRRTSAIHSAIHIFTLESFLHKGVLPFPAA